MMKDTYHVFHSKISFPKARVHPRRTSAEATALQNAKLHKLQSSSFSLGGSVLAHTTPGGAQAKARIVSPRRPVVYLKVVSRTASRRTGSTESSTARVETRMRRSPSLKVDLAATAMTLPTRITAHLPFPSSPYFWRVRAS